MTTQNSVTSYQSKQVSRCCINFSAWTHLSNFDQSENKNWTERVTNTCPWWEKSKRTSFLALPVIANWICVLSQFEITILIVRLNLLMHLRKWTLACNHLKTSKLSADNFQKILDGSIPEQVILISEYPVLTAVNWS